MTIIKTLAYMSMDIILNLAVPIVDEYSDIHNGIILLIDGELFYGTLSLGCLFFPAIFASVPDIIAKRGCKTAGKTFLSQLPGVQIGTHFNKLKAIFHMQNHLQAILNQCGVLGPDKGHTNQNHTHLLFFFSACDEEPILAKLIIDQANVFKININQQDTLGRTPLIIGCRKRNAKLVNALLMKNVDVKVCTFVDKNSALHWACLSSNETICKAVLEYALNKNVSLEFKNSEDQTPKNILMSNSDTLTWTWLNHILNVETEEI